MHFYSHPQPVHQVPPCTVWAPQQTKPYSKGSLAPFYRRNGGGNTKKERYLWKSHKTFPLLVTKQARVNFAQALRWLQAFRTKPAGYKVWAGSVKLQPLLSRTWHHANHFQMVSSRLWRLWRLWNKFCFQNTTKAHPWEDHELSQDMNPSPPSPTLTLQHLSHMFPALHTKSSTQTELKTKPKQKSAPVH